MVIGLSDSKAHVLFILYPDSDLTEGSFKAEKLGTIWNNSGFLLGLKVEKQVSQ